MKHIRHTHKKHLYTLSGAGCVLSFLAMIVLFSQHYESSYAATCGDGMIEGAEGCDDSNTTNGDGCSSVCAVETYWTCSGSPSSCDGICADSHRKGSEGCDDGNTTDGDGCASYCQAETGWSCNTATPNVCSAAACGDGYKIGAEGCDDSNTTNGDGCSSVCAVETGFSCSGSPSSCSATCGDGVKASTEGCDDANVTDADGCSSSCTVESGYTCTGTTPSVCTVGTCGDSTKQSGEGCDDGNTTAGDGCSATCTVQTGYTCSNASPNVCATVCGDSIRAGNEGCDDGNAVAGDGCSAACTVETSFTCTNASPSVCTTNCGNGTKSDSEACDDGNKVSGDGCSAGCSIEVGYTCSGSPRSSCATLCGDGLVKGAEPCDGGYGGNATCNFDCTVSSCGDAKANPKAGEECDIGSNSNGPTKTCTSSCKRTTCGDGIVQILNGNGQNEECEPSKDPNCTNSCVVASSDALKSAAPPAVCGDGVTQEQIGETCDNGFFNGVVAGCDRFCHKTFCGNGIVDANDHEQCEPAKDDDGLFVIPTCGKSCSAQCIVQFLSVCSVNASDQQLESGESKAPPSRFLEIAVPAVQSIRAASSSSAQSMLFSPVQENVRSSENIPVITKPAEPPPFSVPVGCGNGIREGKEECDQGVNNSDVKPDVCRQDCTLPHCGDGVTDSAEQCDDGNDILGDGCTSACTLSACGNGVLEIGEECDDGGKNSDTDPNSCSTLCLTPRCGNGVVDTLFNETCDEGLQNSVNIPDRCRPDCHPAHCGDGTKDASEQCDDSNSVNGDGCDSSCHLEDKAHPAAQNVASEPVTVLPIPSAPLISAVPVPSSASQFLSAIADVFHQTFLSLQSLWGR